MFLSDRVGDCLVCRAKLTSDAALKGFIDADRVLTSVSIALTRVPDI